MLLEPNDTWRANVPADVGRLFRACLSSVQRRFGSSPGAALEAMLDHCIETWRCPTPREHRVFERSAGGGDDDTNLTTLCAAHHQHGVHAGVLRISGRAPGRLVFEMPLGRFGSGDLAPP